MASPQQILEDQVIHVKRGRTNQFGFEPAWNSYFDFYLSPKYIDPPLLQLDDVTFHLFLRKNLNDNNAAWRMPSIRQMMRRLSVSQVKLTNMMARLDQAKLLEKVSGYRKGDEGENIPNHYILSDPVQTLDEFLVLAAAGIFGHPLNDGWQGYPCIENQYTPYSMSIQPPVSEINTYKQTLNTKQGDSELDQLWSAVLDTLKLQLPPATFRSFVESTRLTALGDGVATIELANPSAKDWIENRLARQIKQILYIEGKMLNPKMHPVDHLHIEIQDQNL